MQVRVDLFHGLAHVLVEMVIMRLGEMLILGVEKSGMKDIV
ncbi:hypothetical protein QW131_08955 [Roseibium salinum]|nr:hypothetical protein [Roseibium salinum]